MSDDAATFAAIRGAVDRLRQDRYVNELNAIPTPQQVAQERAKAAQDAADQEQSSARMAQQLTAPASTPSGPMQGAANQISATQSAVIQGLVPSAISPAGKKGASSAIGASNSSPLNNSAQPTIADQIEYMRKTAAVAMKHGQLSPDHISQMENVINNMKAEGLNHAVALMDRGDIQGGQDVYNSIGGHRIKVIDSKDSSYDAGGIKLPTKLVTIEDDDGHRETIDTAHFMHSATGMDNMIKQGQEQYKNVTGRLNSNAEIIKANAEMIKAGAAKTKADKDKPENLRPYVNDGVNQLALAFGAKLDPVSKMMDMSAINDPAGYRAAAAQLEDRVNNGESPMAVAQELANQAMRKQAITSASGKSGVSYPTPWKK